MLAHSLLPDSFMYFSVIKVSAQELGKLAPIEYETISALPTQRESRNRMSQLKLGQTRGSSATCGINMNPSEAGRDLLAFRWLAVRHFRSGNAIAWRGGTEALPEV